MEKLDPTHLKIGNPKKADVAKIVNAYLEARGISRRIRGDKELQARFPYPRMASRAKLKGSDG